jgi:release factor glutamine methyltransferase
VSAGGTLAGQTVAVARRMMTARLRDHAIESPELDARLLIGARLGLDLTGLMGAAERILNPQDADFLNASLDRRIAGEPVARIIGTKEFWGLSLQLSADTLVPRPDTETIVEAVLDLLRTAQRSSQPLRIADLGTGSGAILLALLSELPHATGIATDINLDALRTARANAVQLGLISRASFALCDYASALTDGLDLIVSNPPYIPSADIAALDIEVRTHDPWRALDGGRDGLDAYRIIVPEAARLLAPGGWLVVEVGHDQSNDVGALMIGTGLTLDAPPRTDLGGIRRAVSGRK